MVYPLSRAVSDGINILSTDIEGALPEDPNRNDGAVLSGCDSEDIEPAKV